VYSEIITHGFPAWLLPMALLLRLPLQLLLVLHCCSPLLLPQMQPPPPFMSRC